MNGLVVEINLGKIVHAMMQLRLKDIVSHHGVKQFPFNLDSAISKHENIIFYVLTYLQAFGIFKYRPDNFNQPLSFILFFWNGHIPCFMRPDTETHSHNIRCYGIGTCCFSVKAYKILIIYFGC